MVKFIIVHDFLDSPVSYNQPCFDVLASDGDNEIVVGSFDAKEKAEKFVSSASELFKQACS